MRVTGQLTHEGTSPVRRTPLLTRLRDWQRDLQRDRVSFRKFQTALPSIRGKKKLRTFLNNENVMKEIYFPKLERIYYI